MTGQKKKRHFGLVRLDPEKPSPAILGDTGCTTAGPVHPYEIRKLTIAEIKALASYPEEFQLVGSYRARWTRITNSVPPLLMKAIAEHIRSRFFISTSTARYSVTFDPARPVFADFPERDFGTTTI